MTMANGYFKDYKENEWVVFDVFYRKNPDEGGFAIFAGLEQVIDYLENMHFSNEDIEYLRSLNLYSDEFLSWLKEFKFKGDIYAIDEGTIMYPNEPILTVYAPLIDAQLIETAILAEINHQSLIATKTRRIVKSAKGRAVSDFGARRAHNVDSAVYGARAAFIGGVNSTATVLAGQMFNIPVSGTMAHSWVMYHDNEYEAFKKFAEIYPDNAILLVDTYDVLHSGVPRGEFKIYRKRGKEVLMPMGKRLKGVRLDSGDLAYLSKKVRKMLDESGLNDCIIVASNSLDEFTIKSIIEQGGKIDSFGVGERLITAKSEPVFGGVYKLMAVEENGEIVPRIKLSENVEKVTNPGYKQVWRLFDRESNKAIADVITLAHEVIDDSKEYEIFDPVHTWKKKLVTNFYAKKLQVPVFLNGECVYESPAVLDIKAHCRESVNSLWDEQKRFTNPQEYYVDLSPDLWNLKNEMINKYSEK